MATNNPFINNGAPTTGAGTAPMPTQSIAPSTDGFEVDLTDVQDQSYAIPDGMYRAKCTEVSQDVSKSGNPMFVWEFMITQGEFSGRTFKSWTAITPAAMWKVAEIVIALGIGQQGQVVKFKRQDVLNKECGLVMEQDEYNGKITSKITRVISLAELTETLRK